MSTSKCPTCGQVIGHGHGGEYPCPDCKQPVFWDDIAPDELRPWQDSLASNHNATADTEAIALHEAACTDPIRLNLGSGAKPIYGYINVDVGYEPGQHLGDDEIWRDGAIVYPLNEYPDGYVGDIRASHVLEHFSHTQTADVLREWIRVLKPGGWLKIAVPDFRWIASTYVTDPNAPVNIQGYLMGGHVDDNDHHGAIFDGDGLAMALHAIGLVDIQPWASDADDCSSLPVSLNIMGRKPVDENDHGNGATLQTAPVEPEIIYEDVPDTYGITVDAYRSHPMRRFAGVKVPHGSVRAVLTQPRLGFTQSAYDAYRAFTILDNLPWMIGGGVYQKSIENLMDAEREGGAQYILTLDYDTVFDWRDVQTLYALMEEHPEVGAMCAVQMRREGGTVLIGLRDPNTDEAMCRVDFNDMQADLLPIATGHFGLTIIRASCLETVKRPWFEMVPSPEGKWDENSIDADVNFWLKFRDAGHQLCQANRVVIGHCEMVVTWPDRVLNPMVQPSTQYAQYGRPGEGSGLWR